MSLPESPYIFVSYSSRDRHFVHPEIMRLERQGYKVWYDKGELQPGRLWEMQIQRAIEQCACFIVFISEESVNSRNVCDEIEQALKANKPLICIHWEKTELPPRFRETLRSIQALERYALHRDEYEGPLARALADYIKPTEHAPVVKDKGLGREVYTPPPDARTDVLPKIVFFALVLSAAACLFLAFVTPLIPYFASTSPGDPFNSHLAGYATGVFFLFVAAVVGLLAFAVYRVYLRRRNG